MPLRWAEEPRSRPSDPPKKEGNGLEFWGLRVRVYGLRISGLGFRVHRASGFRI